MQITAAGSSRVSQCPFHFLERSRLSHRRFISWGRAQALESAWQQDFKILPTVVLTRFSGGCQKTPTGGFFSPHEQRLASNPRRVRWRSESNDGTTPAWTFARPSADSPTMWMLRVDLRRVDPRKQVWRLRLTTKSGTHLDLERCLFSFTHEPTHPHTLLTRLNLSPSPQRLRNPSCLPFLTAP